MGESISAPVFGAVLFGALLSAVWNAVVKSSTDKYLDIALISTGSAILCAIALPFMPLPARASWPCIAAATVLEQIYFVLLAAVYRMGDMSEGYPLMRGTAPLLVAIAGGVLIGEVLPIEHWISIGLICGGAIALALQAHRRGTSGGSTVPFALLNAIVIAGYTMVDGVGARLSGAPVSYVMWLFAFTAIPPLAWVLVFRRSAFIAHARKRVVVGMLGGASTLGAYGISLWAMTLAPIALVAALRETSILFATAIAAVVLRERIGLPRYVAIGLIALGAITLRLQA